MSKEMIKLNNFLAYLGLEKRKYKLSHRLPFSKFCMGVDLKKNEQQTANSGNVVLDSADLKEANSQDCSNSA